MCGINGFNFPDRKHAELMNKAIKHRGPDDEGIFSDQNVSLGHVRLSVIDLSEAGRQPMTYRHGERTATIVFNGEIYNFIDIRRELQEKGYTFKSSTDSEVAVASYLEWDFECLNHFNGMWAFAIYDPERRILFCSRDRLGVKPFYYYFNDGKFIFSSELKGILAHDYLCLNNEKNINKEAVELYFSLGYIPSPHTIYLRAFKLEPRQNLVFDLPKKEIRKWTYYAVPSFDPVNDMKQLVEEGRRLLRDAVRLRLISDVPIGALLSGGLDSSTVVASMRELTEVKNMHTFSVGFEGRYDETAYVDIIRRRFGTNHHHIYFDQQDFENLIEAYSYIFDEPFGDYSGFPTHKLCKEAKRCITVALTGDGGDEIFGGYPEHVMAYRMDFIRSIPKMLRKVLSKIPARRKLDSYASLFLLKRALVASLYDPVHFYEKALEGEIATPEVCRRWMAEKMGSSFHYGGGTMAETIRLYDLLYNTLADNYLAKSDRASMFNALELRSPFLDYRFVEFSQKIPTKWKVDLFRTKRLMREMIRDILPERIVRRGKQGFVPPLQDWILDSRYDNFTMRSLEMLRDLSPILHQFLKDRVMKENSRLYRRYRIRLFLFGKWMDRWIKRTSSAPSEISDDMGMAVQPL